MKGILSGFGALATVIGLISVAAGNVSATQASSSPIELSQDLVITEIEPDFFMVTHSFPWPENSMIARVSPEDVVFVDTPYENSATKLAVEWIQKKFGKVRITEINTGFHCDNLGGNGYLLSSGIPVYGPDLTATLLKERSEKTRAMILEMLAKPEQKRFYDAHKALQFFAPDHLFNINEGLKLKFGKEEIEVFFPGASHSPDNVVVYFPAHRILFGGCMVKSLESKTPGFTGDADMKEWPESVRKVMERYPDAKVIIPGHGSYGDRALLSHTISLLKK